MTYRWSCYSLRICTR